MRGLHLTADLRHCNCELRWLTQTQVLGPWCLQMVQECGLNAVSHIFHTFPATAQGIGGITAAVLLAESHLCIHTWPELRSATMDVYVCNLHHDNAQAASTLLDKLIVRFAPKDIDRRTLERSGL